MSADKPSVQGQLRKFYDDELPARATRPIGAERERVLHSFIERCAAKGWNRVLEVGCGAGRDGRVISDAGLEYTGVDLSPRGVEICRDQGLVAYACSAVQLPFADDTFDASWSMSTLMHLPDDGMELALSELRRVTVPGGILEVGVWGKTEGGEWFDPHGRYFRQRSDEDLQSLLAQVGDVTAFETWHWFDDGGHYQWARVRVRDDE